MVMLKEKLLLLQHFPVVKEESYWLKDHICFQGFER